LPFVGASITATGASALFGYIFGTNNYVGGTAAVQNYFTNHITYYIPTGLRSVNIAGGVLRYGAFSGCEGLMSITISSNVTDIGERAFMGCKSLVVTMQGTTPPTQLSSFSDSGNISQCKAIIVPEAALGAYQTAWAQYFSIIVSDTSVADGFIILGSYLLAYIGSETTVTIPSYITNINHYAFYGCSGLTRVKPTNLQLCFANGSV
jgi:hypothetical protein